jgi:hypothetical protein
MRRFLNAALNLSTEWETALSHSETLPKMSGVA